MTIGERIKTIREKSGMSQVAFADKINVSKQTLYKYENDLITNIPSDKIENIARIGNISPAYLMGWEDKDAPAISNKENPIAPQSLAAHFDGDEYTEEELEEIRRFAEFVKNKRK